MDILKQELFMSDHMHIMIVTMIFDQVIIMQHLISTDKFNDQVILEHLTVICKGQLFIETDVILAIMILALCTRLDR